MTQYLWRAEDMTAPLMLPDTIADKGLSIAGAAELRVLIWLSRNRLQWDAAACGDALGMAAATCESALHFWLEQGLLVTAAAPDAPPAPAARPAAVKPRPDEVLRYQQAHAEFSVLLEAASARLGKAISQGDIATLLYLTDTVGLPMDVILTEIAYAVSLGKANMRYVETLALNWADRGLTDFESVDVHIRHLETCQKAAARLLPILGLSRPLNESQSELADKWLTEWHFDEEMLRRAAALTADKLGAPKPTAIGKTLAYMDSVLNGWHTAGIDTPDKIPAPAAAKKGAAATNPEESGLILDELEQALRHYTPVFKPKT